MNMDRDKTRVWHIPQIPGKPFHVPVQSLGEAVLVLDALAHYDLFQFNNNIKPDYANAQGLEVLEDGEWMEWHDDINGKDIGEYMESAIPDCECDEISNGETCVKCGPSPEHNIGMKNYKELEKQVELAVSQGEKSYIDTEGDLDYALRAAIRFYTQALLDHLEKIEPAKQSHELECLADIVDEYLHWRKVNPHIKGGENYLKRLRDATKDRIKEYG